MEQPLKQKIEQKIKEAMKEKNALLLDTLRSIKSEILLEETKGGDSVLDSKREIELLQKLKKQRKDAEKQFVSQGRDDLASVEKQQSEILESFLPPQLTDEEITAHLKEFIDISGVTSAKDFGKVMGMASGKLKGIADGSRISALLKTLLN